MSKTLSAELLAHYAGNAHTLARLWKITRRDALVYGFTDHDAAIEYLGVDYLPSSVFDASAVETRGELNVDSVSSIGLIDAEGLTAQELEAGIWDGAAVQIVEVNYADLSMGHNPLRAGTMGQVERRGLMYAVEMRGLMSALQNAIGRIVKPACDASLGDARCMVDVEAMRVSGEVTVATSARLFTTDLGGADTYSFGVLTWTVGANEGLSMEVKSHTATGVLELQIPMAYPVQVNDEFTVVPGCDKTKATCIATFDNVVNFRGFSFVPGQDKVLLVGGQ